MPTYTLVVTNAGTVVTANWISVDDAIPTSPNLIITSSNPADEGTY
jgi:uncharacterized repeat protein (TIGR01451 family)